MEIDIPNSSKENFTIKEVRQLVKNAYEVGFCDGLDDCMNDIKNYHDADDFWEKNFERWLNEPINYLD